MAERRGLWRGLSGKQLSEGHKYPGTSQTSSENHLLIPGLGPKEPRGQGLQEGSPAFLYLLKLGSGDKSTRATVAH